MDITPITESDIDEVAEFLHYWLNRRMSVADWARAIRPSWPSDAPNHGFLLRDNGQVAGAYVAYYADRRIDGAVERICNLGPWCVRPDQRLHSLRLLKALLAQPGYHFTDLSPGSNVMALNRRLGFEVLDTTTAFTPFLPWPTVPGRGRVSCDPAVIERSLSGEPLTVYRDHATASAAAHLVLLDGDDVCYVMYRKDRRKQLRGLVFLIAVLYVSNPPLFHRMFRQFARHMLVRHAAFGSLAELRVVERAPAGSQLRPNFRPKMFRSDRLKPEHIDNLYSELVCVPW